MLKTNQLSMQVINQNLTVQLGPKLIVVMELIKYKRTIDIHWHCNRWLCSLHACLAQICITHLFSLITIINCVCKTLYIYISYYNKMDYILVFSSIVDMEILFAQWILLFIFVHIVAHVLNNYCTVFENRLPLPALFNTYCICIVLLLPL